MANERPLRVNDFKAFMKERLPKSHYDYVEGGADNCWTLENNLTAWKTIRIRPRYLTGLSRNEISTTVNIFGNAIKSPIWITPCSFHGIAHIDKEIATVKGCKRYGNAMVVSPGSTTSFKEIMKASDGTFLGAQVDPPKTMEALDKLIERIEYLNYKFIIVTIDVPVLGNRLDDIRNQFNMPKHLSMPEADEIVNDVLGSSFEHSENEIKENIESRDIFNRLNFLKENMAWEDVRYITTKTNLNVIVKGVLTGEDALKALESGASGVVVSNHGGRQLDSVASTMEALPEIISAVGSKIPVFVDGGIRHGSDVFKALALGATAVFIGRPIYWGLAYNGADGVADVLDILQQELERTMMLAGCKNISSITKEHIVHESQLVSRLARSCASKL